MIFIDKSKLRSQRGLFLRESPEKNSHKSFAILNSPIVL
jgi:hypothetical protein